MANKKLVQLYDKQYEAGEWQGPLWYRMLAGYIKDREKVVAELVPSSTEELLDLGCGEGNLLKLCQDKNLKMVGVDLLSSRLKVARAKFISNSNIKLIQHDLDKALPFRANHFDAVTMISVLEYVIIPEQALREVWRVLKPGGYLIIEVPNLAFILERFRLMRGELVGQAHAPGWQGGRLHHFTYSTLKKLLENSGFSVLDHSNSGIFNNFRRVIPSLLASDIIYICKKN